MKAKRLLASLSDNQANLVVLINELIVKLLLASPSNSELETIKDITQDIHETCDKLITLQSKSGDTS